MQVCSGYFSAFNVSCFLFFTLFIGHLITFVRFEEEYEASELLNLLDADTLIIWLDAATFDFISFNISVKSLIL